MDSVWEARLALRRVQRCAKDRAVLGVSARAHGARVTFSRAGEAVAALTEPVLGRAGDSPQPLRSAQPRPVAFQSPSDHDSDRGPTGCNRCHILVLINVFSPKSTNLLGHPEVIRRLKYCLCSLSQIVVADGKQGTPEGPCM